jgi:hypothetical protein
MTDTSSIRREMAATRTEMAQDVEELEHRASERVQAVKQRLDVGRVIRDNPWPALGAAIALGAIIAGSGADEAAAAATVTATKKASRATADAVKQTAKKIPFRGKQSSDADGPRTAPEKPGVIDRFFDGVGLSIASGLDRVLDEMRAASREWGARMANRGETRPQPVSARAPAPSPVTPSATAPVVATAIVVREEVVTTPAPSPADAVPLPNEIAPAELGARADAVEAMGGGTNEPPLEPGAGELGARW